MIPADVFAKLPDAARQKLMLIDGLAADADDMANAAQERLNEIGRRRQVGAEDPNVPRLAAVVETRSQRHAELMQLILAIQRWARALPEDPQLDVVTAPSPPALMAEGETLTPEEAVMRLRARIGELTVERMEVARAPEPKAAVKQRMRSQIARLADIAKPTLSLERGAAEAAVFRNMRMDLPGEAYLVGLLGWFDPGRMDAALSSMVDDLPDAEAMDDAEHKKALIELDREIEALGRAEEGLITDAFERGTDVLRRAQAAPQCVLGVRLRAAERPARRPRLHLPGPPARAAAE